MIVDRHPMDCAVPLYDAVNCVAESLRYRGADAVVHLNDNSTTASVSMFVSAYWNEDEARSVGALIKLLADKGHGRIYGDAPGSSAHEQTGGAYDFVLSFTIVSARLADASRPHMMEPTTTFPFSDPELLHPVATPNA